MRDLLAIDAPAPAALANQEEALSTNHETEEKPAEEEPKAPTPKLEEAEISEVTAEPSVNSVETTAETSPSDKEAPKEQ